MEESWRVFKVQMTAPAMGTAKWSSCTAGTLGARIAIYAQYHSLVIVFTYYCTIN